MGKAGGDYWQRKIARNKDRDAAHVLSLKRDGWNVLVLWECELRDQSALRGRLTKLLSERKENA